MSPKLLLIGNGKMGAAFISLLLNDFEITVVSPNSKPKQNLAYFTSVDQVKESFDVIVFAVKPWILSIVMPLLNKHMFDENTLFVSIITGASISYFKQNLGENAKIVRVMPNLTCQIGKGIMAIYPDIPCDFLNKLGKIVYVKEELDIDKFTSFTGSGSGFVFSILEMYQNSTKKLEIKTPIDEHDIIIELFEGALALLKETKLSFKDQKNKVVVQKGTTFEGLKALDQCAPLFDQSLQNAYHRASQIGEETMANLSNNAKNN